ncbi:glycoside hydrolase family 19 protein [Comamonas sp. HJ-2]
MKKLTAEIVAAGTGSSLRLAASWVDVLAITCQTYGIDTEKRVAMFLAQIGHESGSLVYTRELWGPTPAQKTYERDPGQAWSATNARNKKAFTLGNAFAGDGKRYMGRGLIQVTGRGNYAEAYKRMSRIYQGVPNFVMKPEDLELPQWAALSAGDFWDSRNLNALADRGEFTKMTSKINGGTNGEDHRQQLFFQAIDAIHDV